MLMMQEIDTTYKMIIMLFSKGFTFKSLFAFNNLNTT